MSGNSSQKAEIKDFIKNQKKRTQDFSRFFAFFGFWGSPQTRPGTDPETDPAEHPGGISQTQDLFFLIFSLFFDYFLILIKLLFDCFWGFQFDSFFFLIFWFDFFSIFIFSSNIGRYGIVTVHNVSFRGSYSLTSIARCATVQVRSRKNFGWKTKTRLEADANTVRCWWLQPTHLKHMLVKMGSSSPRIRGENNIMFETTTQIYITTSWKSCENSLLNCIYLVFGDVSWDRLCVYT